MNRIKNCVYTLNQAAGTVIQGKDWFTCKWFLNICWASRLNRLMQEKIFKPLGMYDVILYLATGI